VNIQLTMKTCPYCGRENLDTAPTCAACGETFDTPPTSETKTDPLLSDPALNPVIVAKFSNLQQASILAGRLNDAGIEAWIPEEYSEQVFSGVVGLERLTVQVAAKDRAEAMAIVAETTLDSTVAARDNPQPAPLKTTPGQPGRPELTAIAGPTRLCVSCGKPIPINSTLCPICDYAQPRPAPANS
jgi:hypothetical protein